jgi:hypothetical protein
MEKEKKGEKEIITNTKPLRILDHAPPHDIGSVDSFQMLSQNVVFSVQTAPYTPLKQYKGRPYILEDFFNNIQYISILKISLSNL